MAPLLFYIVLSFYFLQRYIIYGTDRCPPKRNWKSVFNKGEMMYIPSQSRVLISYGTNGKYIIIAVENQAIVKEPIRCHRNLAASDLSVYGDLHNLETCCVGTAFFDELGSWSSWWILENINMMCIKSTHSWSSHKELKKSAECRDERPDIQALVQCNIKKKRVCDFKYKNIPTWIAYGNPETNNLIFKLIISDDGTIKCTPNALDFNTKHVLLHEQIKNCYVATNGHDVEPHFGVWKLRGFCDGCKDFAYQFQVGVTLGVTETKTKTNTANIVLKPSIIGKELFNLGATHSRAVAVATSDTRADTELFRFHCPEERPYIYQRQLNIYHMDEDGYFQYIEAKLPMARCHPNGMEPPQCGSGKCKNEDGNENCQICDEVAMHEPPSPLLNFNDDWSAVKIPPTSA